MWLYLIAVPLILLGIILGLAGGGIFTIVLVPLGLIALATAVLTGAGGRRAQSGEGATSERPGDLSKRPLPHSPPRDTGHELTSPEGLADARRTSQ
jgi:hypothetical protein